VIFFANGDLGYSISRYAYQQNHLDVKVVVVIASLERNSAQGLTAESTKPAVPLCQFQTGDYIL
jgi:hypothetical protein